LALFPARIRRTAAPAIVANIVTSVAKSERNLVRVGAESDGDLTARLAGLVPA
jgi:hypothetical protein